MDRIYVDIKAVAHIFRLQNIREEKHRNNYYRNDEKQKKLVETEVKTALAYTFAKILEVAEMSNLIADYDRQRIKSIATNSNDHHFKTHDIIKGE